MLALQGALALSGHLHFRDFAEGLDTLLSGRRDSWATQLGSNLLSLRHRRHPDRDFLFYRLECGFQWKMRCEEGTIDSNQLGTQRVKVRLRDAI